MTLAELRSHLNTLRADADHARRTAKAERAALAAAQDQLAAATEGQRVLQDVAASVQQEAHRQIASVASRCLKAVFPDDPHTFEVLFEKKRGKTEARLAFSKAGREVDPQSEAAGGMIDVAALALRLSAILMRRPRLRPVLILDEPFKNINGPDNQDRAGALIETLARDLGFQFVIVTDDDWLKVGRVVEL